MPLTELRKQISIFLPLSEWRALRAEAARRKVPITELCRQWLTPHLESLRDPSHADADRPDLNTAVPGRREHP